jgi:hypothetical protein
MVPISNIDMFFEVSLSRAETVQSAAKSASGCKVLVLGASRPAGLALRRQVAVRGSSLASSLIVLARHESIQRCP